MEKWQDESLPSVQNTWKPARIKKDLKTSQSVKNKIICSDENQIEQFALSCKCYV